MSPAAKRNEARPPPPPPPPEAASTPSVASNSRHVPDQDESVRPALIEAHVFRAFRRDLSNLSPQEAACAASAKKTPPPCANCKPPVSSRRMPASRMLPTSTSALSKTKPMMTSIPLRLASNFHSGKSRCAP